MEQKNRLESLDALRGFDMMFIMGMAPLVVALCSLFPGGSDCWLASQMEHVNWNGWHHHDTIFPLFLFIAGVTWPFSYSRKKESGVSTAGIYKKVICRALALIALGIVYNGFFNFHFDTLRYFSVLGRIGLAWMFAAIIYMNCGKRARAIISAFILLGYWGICHITAPDAPGADPLSQEGNFVGYVDRLIFSGHLCYGNFDPEGLVSVLPSIVTALLGMFAGEWVMRKDISGNRKSTVMFAAAALLFALGYVWSIWFPINKKLWTSSFVLVIGGFSLAAFALFYWIIDVKGWRKWAFPFKVIGMNSITIYLGQCLIDFAHTDRFFLGGLMGLCPEAVANLVFWIGYVALCYLALLFLYKKKIFLKV